MTFASGKHALITGGGTGIGAGAARALAAAGANVSLLGRRREPLEAVAAETGGRVQPKRPGEFTCQSCFLVKPPSQLADADNMYCLDCV